MAEKGIKLPKKPNAKLLDVMRFFTYKSGGHTSQRRIAKLIYLSELLFFEKNNKSLTGADFISYAYGPWSFDFVAGYDSIEAECEDMKIVPIITSKGQARNLQPTKSSTAVGINKEEWGVLSMIFDTFGYARTDLIVDFTKKAWLFRHTSYCDLIDFSTYVEKRKSAIEKLKKASINSRIKLPSMGYLLNLRIEEIGYSAECEELPGCITEGDTLEELEENMRQAILGYLECEDELSENAS